MRVKLWIALTTALAVLVQPALLAPRAWAGAKYKVLHNFGSSNDGSLPAGPVILGRDGILYGATYGGDAGCKGGDSGGTAFQLTRQTNGTWSEGVLYCFSGQWTDGFPDAGVIIDSKGNLFGTSTGGVHDLSNVYELTRGAGGWDFSVLYNLGGGGLLLDGLGDVYGYLGPGTYKAGAVGELSPGSGGWVYRELYSFCESSCYNGVEPNSPPGWDTHLNLYGTTLYGGNDYPKCPWSGGCGVAFRMTPKSDGTWTYHVLHRFASFKTDGLRPYAGLVVDPAGNAYGATWAGGAHGNGTIFKLTPSTGGRWKQTVLYDFPNCADGCAPTHTLVLDRSGNLYGSGPGGNSGCGPYTCGTIFKLTHQKDGKWKYSVVYKFHGADGAFPYGVILDDKGDIFGTTENGGAYNSGVAFEITP
jgi:uncharacterized repeat protein (TIGR03803 family)